LSDEYRQRNPNRITRELEIAVMELESAVKKKPRKLKESKKEFTKEFTTKFAKKFAKKKSLARKFREMNYAPNA